MWNPWPAGDRARLQLAAVSIAVVASSWQPSHAADIEVDLDRTPCEIRISGFIKSGDLAKLKSKLPRDFQFAKAGPTVCLNSPLGGDFVEGLDIARFIANGLSTYLEPNAACVSACSWIFMAGTNLMTGGSFLSRSMHLSSALSFHAPYISQELVEPQNRSQDQARGLEAVIRAYSQAVSEIGEGVLKLARQHTTARTDPLIPASLLAEAFVKTGDKVLSIDTVGKVLRWKINVDGVTGVIPKSKQDVAMVCRNALASVNEFWDWNFLYEAQMAEYIAFFEPKERVLTAQVVLSNIGSAACEVRITFGEDMKDVEIIDVIANLRWEDSIGRKWIKYMRDPQTVQWPNYALASPDTSLRQLPQALGAPVDLRSLTTVGSPAWCKEQTQKAPDESAICDSARLSAFDVLMERYFREYTSRITVADRSLAQSQQREWLSKRRQCEGNEECLDQAYLKRIGAVREKLDDLQR